MSNVPQISITKFFTFESGHQIPGHKGKCARPHGHSYKLEVEVVDNSASPHSGSCSKIFDLLHQGKSPQDCEDAMVVDFSDVKRIVKGSIVDLLDHQDLNTLKGNSYLPGFPYYMTTAEMMAAWIFERLTDLFAIQFGDGILLKRIRLWETATCYAEVVRS